MKNHHLIILLTAFIALFCFQNACAQRAKNCDLCYGTGKCQTCYGKGGETHHYGHNISYRECGACRGTGRCTYCNGSGLDPNQDYTADVSAINVAASVAAGAENPKKHTLEARNSHYEAVRLTTNDEKNWLVEKGSAKTIPDGWSLVGNYTQFGEDTNYWFISKDANDHSDALAVPKNSYGNVMTVSGDDWETLYYIPHDYRFINVDAGDYCYQKTFYGPVWLKMAKPYGGTGMLSLVDVYEETREDDNYWYIKNGGTELSLSKTGNEVGKYSQFTPVEPSSLKTIEENGDGQSDDSNDKEDKSVEDVLSGLGKSKTGGNNTLMWIGLVLLSMVVGALCMFKYMKRRDGQSVLPGKLTQDTDKKTEESAQPGKEPFAEKPATDSRRQLLVAIILLLMLIAVILTAMTSKGMAIILILLFLVMILTYWLLNKTPK